MLQRPLRDTLNPKSLSLMGVSKRFLDVSLSDFNTYGKASLVSVRDFFQSYIEDLDHRIARGEGVCMFGSNGVGKSMLSCIVLKEVYRHRYSCRRATFMDIINAYAEEWDRESVDREEYHIFKGAKFLVIEEIGKEFDNRLSSRVLEDLLRYREEQSLVTFICTNMTPENLSVKYGPSISSLIQGNMTVITIEEVDRRVEGV